MKTLWWIERKNGKLAPYGRHIHKDGNMGEGGGPNLSYYMYGVKKFCKTGERPVKVMLVKVKE